MAVGDRIRKATVSAEPFRKSDGRVSYPARTSLDLTPQQYAWLKEESWKNRESAAGLLRLMIDRCMADPRLLEQILNAP